MINVFYSGDKNYFKQIFLSTLSMAMHTKESLNIYIMTLDCKTKKGEYFAITSEQIAFLEKTIKEYNVDSKITLVRMDDLYEKNMANNCNKNSVYTPYALLRLLSHHLDMLPEKIIYLDTDTMVYNDINELYSIDLEDAEYGAVQDYVGHHFFGKNYINTGVLLLNLKRIRETGLFDKCIDYVATKRRFMPDQDAINYRRTKFKMLPRKFNEQRDVVDDTVIKHFCKIPHMFPIIHTVNIKQTNLEGVHNVLKITAFDEVYDKYLEITKGVDKELHLDL